MKNKTLEKLKYLVWQLKIDGVVDDVNIIGSYDTYYILLKNNKNIVLTAEYVKNKVKGDYYIEVSRFKNKNVMIKKIFHIIEKENLKYDRFAYMVVLKNYVRHWFTDVEYKNYILKNKLKIREAKRYNLDLECGMIFHIYYMGSNSQVGYLEGIFRNCKIDILIGEKNKVDNEK